MTAAANAARIESDRMSKQIQVRWDSKMGDDYDATVEALTSYPVQPSITASLSIKGDASPEVLRQLVHVASEHGLQVNTTLTATFTGEEAEGMQLRLFGPPRCGRRGHACNALGIVALGGGRRRYPAHRIASSRPDGDCP